MGGEGWYGTRDREQVQSASGCRETFFLDSVRRKKRASDISGADNRYAEAIPSMAGRQQPVSFDSQFRHEGHLILSDNPENAKVRFHRPVTQ